MTRRDRSVRRSSRRSRREHVVRRPPRVRQRSPRRRSAWRATVIATVRATSPPTPTAWSSPPARPSVSARSTAPAGTCAGRVRLDGLGLERTPALGGRRRAGRWHAASVTALARVRRRGALASRRWTGAGRCSLGGGAAPIALVGDRRRHAGRASTPRTGQPRWSVQLPRRAVVGRRASIPRPARSSPRWHQSDAPGGARSLDLAHRRAALGGADRRGSTAAPAVHRRAWWCSAIGDGDRHARVEARDLATGERALADAGAGVVRGGDRARRRRPARWRWSTTSASSPLLDLATGRLRWQHDLADVLDRHPDASSPRDRVAFTSFAGVLLVLDRRDGHVVRRGRRRGRLGGLPRVAPAAGAVAGSAGAGVLVALRLRRVGSGPAVSRPDPALKRRGRPPATLRRRPESSGPGSRTPAFRGHPAAASVAGGRRNNRGAARPGPATARGRRPRATARTKGRHRGRSNGRRHHEAAAGGRSPLRSPDPALEPEDEAVHLRRAQRDLHHRPAADPGAHRHRLPVRAQHRRGRRHRPVRRHEEAGPGADPEAGRPRRNSPVRELPLARRDAHQLPDRARPRREAARARAAGRDRRDRADDQEGRPQGQARGRQARAQPRRHPQPRAGCPTRSS